MSVDRLKRDLLNKLINVRTELATYLQLRMAKGNMSVGESERLRDSCFTLCNYLRENAQVLERHYDESEQLALRRAAQALSTIAVCIMSGHLDCHCPTFISVDARTLENGLTALTDCIECLKEPTAQGQP